MKLKVGRPSKGQEKKTEIMCIAWTKQEREFIRKESIKCGAKAQDYLRLLVHTEIQKIN